MQQGRKLILCIDDEQVGLHVRKVLLERAGYDVLTAPDGPSGLSIFREHPIDAVVLDYAMPGMDGGQVAAEMRRIKPDVPLVLLSAYLGLAPEVIRNVSVYMTKGEGAPALLGHLQRLLSA